MGKNISVYLDDNLSNMVESSGLPASKVIQLALKKFFLADNRKQAFDQFASAARDLGKTHNFKAIVKDWETEREIDRW
jgi:hypothetical protein